MISDLLLLVLFPLWKIVVCCIKYIRYLFITLLGIISIRWGKSRPPQLSTLVVVVGLIKFLSNEGHVPN